MWDLEGNWCFKPRLYVVSREMEVGHHCAPEREASWSGDAPALCGAGPCLPPWHPSSSIPQGKAQPLLSNTRPLCSALPAGSFPPTALPESGFQESWELER